MNIFENKVAVITGAASGIGRALAVELSLLGCHLALADLNREGLLETKEQVAGNERKITVHPLDVSIRDDVYSFADDVEKEHGQADILINNAGVSTAVSVEALDYPYFESLMKINFWAVVYGCKAFLPLLKKQPRAHIVNVSSIFAVAVPPRFAAYSAPKAAVRAFTETLAAEFMVEKIPIGVSCVIPGGVRTGIVQTTEKHIRDFIENRGYDMSGISQEKFRQLEAQAMSARRLTEENPNLSTPRDAALGIIEGIRKNDLRILVGDGAREMDEAVRRFPDRYMQVLADAGNPYWLN